MVLLYSDESNLQSYDGNLLAGPSTQSLERTICGQPCAKHRCSEIGLQAIRDLEGKVFMRADMT
jgi:hypothetical protein